jgi:isoquinoline 1-oxidoreductase subunit beta
MALMGDDQKAACYHESFESVVSYVVEAKITGKGNDRKPVLTAVTAGVHCNFCVNPRTVETQMQGSVTMALANHAARPPHHAQGRRR